MPWFDLFVKAAPPSAMDRARQIAAAQRAAEEERRRREGLKGKAKPGDGGIGSNPDTSIQRRPIGVRSGPPRILAFWIFQTRSGIDNQSAVYIAPGVANSWVKMADEIAAPAGSGTPTDTPGSFRANNLEEIIAPITGSSFGQSTDKTVWKTLEPGYDSYQDAIDTAGEDYAGLIYVFSESGGVVTIDILRNSASAAPSTENYISVFPLDSRSASVCQVRMYGGSSIKSYNYEYTYYTDTNIEYDISNHVISQTTSTRQNESKKARITPDSAGSSSPVSDAELQNLYVSIANGVITESTSEILKNDYAYTIGDSLYYPLGPFGYYGFFTDPPYTPPLQLGQRLRQKVDASGEYPPYGGVDENAEVYSDEWKSVIIDVTGSAPTRKTYGPDVAGAKKDFIGLDRPNEVNRGFVWPSSIPTDSFVYSWSSSPAIYNELAGENVIDSPNWMWTPVLNTGAFAVGTSDLSNETPQGIAAAAQRMASSSEAVFERIEWEGDSYRFTGDRSSAELGGSIASIFEQTGWQEFSSISLVFVTNWDKDEECASLASTYGIT